ncbi:MAG: nucleoside-diphosphate sugar epimerase/dehydratase [Rhodopila sp.]
MEALGNRNKVGDDTGSRSMMTDTEQRQQTVRSRGLVPRTLCIVGMDMTVALAVGFACYPIFIPCPVPGGMKPAFLIACLSVCMVLCFCERGLYAASEINGQSPNWRNIVLAWVQTVALALLVLSASTVFQDSAAQPQAELPGPVIGVPALLLAGCAGTVVTRAFVARVNWGIVLLNRTVIVGDSTAVQELAERIRIARPARFDIVGAFRIESGATADVPVPPVPQALLALEQMIGDDAVDTVLVALLSSQDSLAEFMIRRLSMAPVDVFLYVTSARPEAATAVLPFIADAVPAPAQG